MLARSAQRIAERLSDSDLVLDVGGWANPWPRADWVLDLMPYETRGLYGRDGEGPERFSAETWVQRDICAREPWPFDDDQFDFVLCVTTLEDVRDPIWVCQEMSRVAKAGYIGVPTIEAELIFNVEGRGNYLGHEHHRWCCDHVDGEMVFLHKSHDVHSDWRLRVVPRWRETMTLEDHLLGVFWEGEIRARERVVIYEYPLDELRERVRAKFQPSRAELAAKEARDALRHRLALARRPLRRAAERVLSRR